MENISIDKVKIETSKDFEKVYDTWKKLECGKEMTIFQSYDWNILLFEEEKKRMLSAFYTDIVIILIRADNNIVGLLPLIIQKHGNKTKWFGRDKGIYILGHGSWSDYLNIIYAENFRDDYFELLVEYLMSNYKGYTFYATDIMAQTSFADYLRKSKAILDKSGIAIQIEKMESVEKYEKSLSKHVRQNLRTAKNRMEKAGIKYDMKILGIVEDDSLINKLVEVHTARMEEKNMVTIDFFHRISSYIRINYRRRQERNNNIVAQSMKRMKESCLIIVYLNGDIAGYLYGLRDKSAIRIMQNCVLNEYKFYSPIFRGAYDFILEQYSDENIKTIDFTRGNEQYKYNLGGEEVGLESYHLSVNDIG